MKKLLFLFFIAFPILASAQVITYDTIRVSPGDERNIHRNRQQQTMQRQQPARERNNRPVLLDNQPTSGFTFDKRKMRFGANLGLSLSRNYTVFGLGPQVGYQFSDIFMAGAGVKYYYTRVRAYDYTSKSNLLGANTFGYLYPVRFLTVFAQPELNYIWSTLSENTAFEDRRVSGFVPSVVVGAGLRLGRSHITMNYDLVQDTRSPYPNGFFLGVSAFF